MISTLGREALSLARASLGGAASLLRATVVYPPAAAAAKRERERTRSKFVWLKGSYVNDMSNEFSRLNGKHSGEGDLIPTTFLFNQVRGR